VENSSIVPSAQLVVGDKPEEVYRKILTSLLWDGMPDPTIVDDPVNLNLRLSGGPSLMKAWTHDVYVIVRSPYPNDFNIADSGYSMPLRWNKFIKDYTDEVGMRDFFRKVPGQKPWEENGYVCWRGSKHTFGNCLLAMTFHTGNTLGQKARVKVMSRSCLFAPTGVLDLGWGVAICKALVERYNFDPSNLELHWDINHLQIASWKMITTCYLQGLLPPDPTEFGSYPQSDVGRTLISHMRDVKNEQYPNLKMFARHGTKMNRLMKGEKKGRGQDVYHPELPEEYFPRQTERATTGSRKPKQRR
jgi:hypothetical protein